ncbi:MAG: hypothetical protein PVG76_00625 [Chromatiales bacterium]
MRQPSRASSHHPVSSLNPQRRIDAAVASSVRIAIAALQKTPMASTVATGPSTPPRAIPVSASA